MCSPVLIEWWGHDGGWRHKLLVQGSQQVHLRFHLSAQSEMVLLDFVQIPLEGGDAIRDVEKTLHQIVTSRLIASEGVVTALYYGPSQKLGVTKGIGDPVRSNGIAEVAGVTDQSPTRPGGASEEAGCARESSELPGALA